MRIKDQFEQLLSERSQYSHFPIYSQKFVAEVRKVTPSDGILCLDNGIYKIWFARNYKAHQANIILLDNALASMGAGLPSAIAAKLIFPERKVIAVCGDGGFMMNSQELETAVRLKLDLTVIILRDDAYGMVKWKQVANNMEEFGLDFTNPDFVKYAESYGAYGQRLEKEEDLSCMINHCLCQKEVQVFEVPIDYSENERVFIQELRKLTCNL